MISTDQLIAAILFVLGLGAGVAALLEPLAGIAILIARYVRKLAGKPSA